MAVCKTYRFTVRGGMRFPLDMLRYDGCWPASGEDASTIGEMIGPYKDRPQVAEVELVSTRPPTEGRWASFSWYVVKQSKY